MTFLTGMETILSRNTRRWQSWVYDLPNRDGNSLGMSWKACRYWVYDLPNRDGNIGDALWSAEASKFMTFLTGMETGRVGRIDPETLRL